MSEVLNVISGSFGKNQIGGPNKVIVNTLKGLDKIGYPYVVNKKIQNYKYNWIHDSVEGLIEVGLSGIPALLGPNIVVLPKDLPRFRKDLKNCIYLHPSQWCVDVWKEIGFSECILKSWPAGIDTEYFNDQKSYPLGNEVLIYFKRRDPLLLYKALDIVIKAGLIPRIINYGEYNESQYKDALAFSRFGIWIGTSESQGIALQEALASDLPLIVCDVQSLFEARGKSDYIFPNRLKYFKPTSAPYFDERCGLIISDFSEIGNAIREISNNISYYKPREYITQNLSLEKQAMELLSLFELLVDNNKGYFQKPFNNSVSRDFKLSSKGRFIFLIFVLRRKFKTFLRLIKNIFRG